MVFHLLFHEDLFRETKGELLIEAGEVAPLQKKKAAGLLNGVRSTGDPAFNDKLQACGAILTHEPVTVFENIITSMGPGSALPFALQLAAYLAGNAVADSFAERWGIRYRA